MMSYFISRLFKNNNIVFVTFIYIFCPINLIGQKISVLTNFNIGVDSVLVLKEKKDRNPIYVSIIRDDEKIVQYNVQAIYQSMCSQPMIVFNENDSSIVLTIKNNSEIDYFRLNLDSLICFDNSILKIHLQILKIEPNKSFESYLTINKSFDCYTHTINTKKIISNGIQCQIIILNDHMRDINRKEIDINALIKKKLPYERHCCNLD